MDASQDSHTVGDVARLTGVTIRTLHHYDEIGLLSPEERSAAGYRVYAETDIDRLHRVLAYRALGLSLEDIEAILDRPGSDDVAQLQLQRELLETQIGRLAAMMKAIEQEMEARRMGIKLTAEERFEVFGDFDPVEHAPEAERRWGGSEAYAESQRRTAAYSKQDWQQIKAEASSVEQRLAAAMAEGEASDSAVATGLAEEHRAHIDRWFYRCPSGMHLALTQMYVDDERFRAHYEDLALGLATYIRDAAAANPGSAVGR